MPNKVAWVLMSFTLNINSGVQKANVELYTPLLWVLRVMLDMKGRAFGSGTGLCGACAAHINGTATRSCITPVSALGNAAIDTVECIGCDAGGARVQRAWISRDEIQCGVLSGWPDSERYVPTGEHPQMYKLPDLGRHGR